MKKSVILYCGMADDVLSPIIIAPNFEKLFAIDLFDAAYTPEATGRWEQQKKEILNLLEAGNDEKSWHLQVYRKNHQNWPITKLKGKCHILQQVDDGRRWQVTFLYMGLQRELIYFHHRNFYDPWPDEIVGVTHLMSMGAVCLRDKYEPKFVNEPLFFDCVRLRCTKDCLYYEGYHPMDDDEFAYKGKFDKLRVRNRAIACSPLSRELTAYDLQCSQNINESLSKSK